ncbi:MAG: Hpt domain-containing protein [Neomegalonema sp.]|nr:Hpt domain-containing protein [Neomegalonema sp.]
MTQAECERGGRDRRVEARCDAGEASPRLDREALAANTGPDRGLHNELFDLYFDQAPVYLDHMRNAISGECRDEWRIGCHGVKGMAWTLGLTVLGDTAHRVQQQGPAKRRLAQVEKLLQESKAAVKAYFSEV